MTQSVALAIDFRSLFAVASSGRRGKVPLYMSLAPPPVDILDGAACTPADAGLFDENRDDASEQGRYGGTERRKRQAKAMRICNGYLGRGACPVKTQCAVWALKNNQLGVYGGQVVTAKTVAQYRRAVTSGDEPQPKEIVA